MRPDLFLCSVLFFFSGACGLIYQVLWIRLFTFVHGSTVESMSAVVTAFLGGLALGAYFGGRAAKTSTHPLAVYGVCELFAVVTAVAGFSYFAEFDLLVRWNVSSAALFFSAFLVTFLAALPIGGCLPALAQAISRERNLAQRIGLLYAVNTLGAAVGAFCAGTVLLRSLGYIKTFTGSLVVTFVLGILGLCFARHFREEPSSCVSTQRPREGNPWVWILSATGFLALGYEVIWFRLAEYYFYGTIQSFALIISCYLFGHGLGAGLSARRSADSAHEAVAVILVSIGLLNAALFPLLSLTAFHQPGSTLLLALFISTFLFGMLFPIALRASSLSAAHSGFSTGRLYAGNTIGAVIGSLMTGFVLIPKAGTEYALLSMILGGFCLAMRLRPQSGRLLIPAAVIVCLIMMLPSGRWLSIIHRHRHEQIAFTTESRMSVLHVREKNNGVRYLTSGPFTSGSTDPIRRFTQQIQAHLAMLVHRDAQDVVEIGYGVGEIARSLLLYQPQNLQLVEIDPLMIPTANAFFSSINASASEGKTVHTTVTDGRQFLQRAREKFDLILTDTMEPASEASLRLYTTEHFTAGRKVLRENGVMVLWLPLYSGASKSQVIMKSFLEVFPNTLLWVSPINLEVYLFGFNGEALLDLSRLEDRFQQIAQPELKLFSYTDVAQFLAGFRSNGDYLRAQLESVKQTNHDLNPIADFVARDEFTGLFFDIFATSPATVLENSLSLLPAEKAAELREKLLAFHEADKLLLQAAPFQPWSASILTNKLSDGAQQKLRHCLALAPGHPICTALLN